MLLDTSDNAWDIFLEIIRKAKDARATWYSPKQQRPYQIADVTEKKIFIKREKGELSELGKRGFLYFLEHFNKGGGKYRRKDYNGNVAKMACIVNFHPLLKWSEDMDVMEVIEHPAKGLISYKDFGSLPDDDITQLQTFARKVRNGQTKFRQRLLEVYNSSCCITGTDVAEALDACHIEPHAKNGVNKTDNGLLLRADIHNLFDLQLLFIEPVTYLVHIHPSLKGTEYYQYHGKIMTSAMKPGSHFLNDKWKGKTW